MSHTYSEFLPSYSVGVDCYKAIPEIVKPYGKRRLQSAVKQLWKNQKRLCLKASKALTLKSLILYGTAVTPAMKTLKNKEQSVCAKG